MNLEECFDWIFQRMLGIAPRFDKDMKALNALKAAVEFAGKIEEAFNEEEYPEYFEERAELYIDELREILTSLTQ